MFDPHAEIEALAPFRERLERLMARFSPGAPEFYELARATAAFDNAATTIRVRWANHCSPSTGAGGSVR